MKLYLPYNKFQNTHKELTREVKNFLNMKKSEKEIVSSYSEEVKKDNFKPVNNSTVKELLKL